MKTSGRKGIGGVVKATELDIAASSVAEGVPKLSLIPVAVAVTLQDV